MDEPAKRVVRGDLVLPSEVGPLEAAEVVVRVEDVSRADAPSVVIAEQRLPKVRLGEGARVPFTIEVPAGQVDDRATYAVSAHVDVSGSGTVERGDLITMESYPVLTRGHPDEIDLRVRRV